MPQFDLAFYLSQTFWVLISFGFLYLLVDNILSPMILRVLDERKRLVAENLAAAEKANKAAEKIMRDYQNYMSSAEQDASLFLKETYQRISQTSRAAELKHDRAMKEKIKKAEEEYRLKALELDRQTGALSRALSDDLVQQFDLKPAAKMPLKSKKRRRV